MNKPTLQPAFPAFTNQPNLAETLGIRETASGRFQVQVVDAKTGKVVESRPWQSNLILDSGLDRIATEAWASQLAYGVAGTGNTPTKDLPDPGDLFSQSGTTVTRDSGTRDFISGDVGKLIRFASGEEAYVTAFIGTTSVTVGTSQTVASGAIDALYRVAQTGLTTETKRSTNEPTFIDDDDGFASQHTRFDATAGTMTFRTTKDFTEEVGSVNYTEVGMSSSATVASNLFSRMLLSGAVTVGIGQLLRLKYELTVSVAGHAVATQTTVDGGITGWPLPYNIVSIVSNGTYWDVTLNETHHFLAGGKINISGAKRPRTDITVAASTVSDFTLTAPGHSITGGQSITVEGMTPSGYNGTFTVASVAGDDIVVTSVLNPGPGTVFGNVRQTEPGTWYDGTDYTIASIPSAAVVRITNATSIAAAGDDGTAFNNVKRKWIATNFGLSAIAAAGGTGNITATEYDACCGSGFNANSNSVMWDGMHDGRAATDVTCFVPASEPAVLANDFPQFYGRKSASFMVAINEAGTTQSPAVTDWIGAATKKHNAQEAYTNGTFYRDTIFAFTAGEINRTDIKTFFFGRGTGYSPSGYVGVQGYFLFEEPQRKKNTYKLTLTLRRSWGRDLTTIPN